jgi:anthranilate phosphoribosyltransferase
MSIAAYIKQIGRGKDGARPISTDQARDLLSQVLDGAVSDLEVGAFCLAMRIKGETVDELDGFVQATLARCLPLAVTPQSLPRVGEQASRGVVVLPSYNGARKLPNLTALLALALAREGVAVLVHGPALDPTRVTTAQVFTALGLAPARDAAQLHAAWQAGRPAFIDIADLCAPLGRLLDVRWTIGLRNPGHTVAKLLDPVLPGGLPSVRVVNHTHPEYAHSLTGYLQHVRADALLMRGTEGEPVADPRRQPRFDMFLNGERHEALSRVRLDGVLASLPELPTAHDADTTARYIEAVLAGRFPVPGPITEQVDCLTQALALAPAGATPA